LSSLPTRIHVAAAQILSTGSHCPRGRRTSRRRRVWGHDCQL